MYLDIKETLGHPRDLEDMFRSRSIYITDFYPYMLDSKLPEIPRSELYDNCVFPLFSEVGTFARFDIELTDPIVQTGICSGDINVNPTFDYSFNDYAKELDEYKEELYRMGYEVTCRSVDELYTSFLEVQKVCSVSGVVAIEGYTLLPTNKVPLCMPYPVYHKYMPIVESYYNTIKDHTVGLSMTLGTLLAMHRNAWDNIGINLSETIWTIDEFSADLPNVNDRIVEVTNALDRTFNRYNIDNILVHDIINENIDDRELIPYYSYMSREFGLRESEARQVLVNHRNVIGIYDSKLRNDMELDDITLKGRLLYLIPEIDERSLKYKKEHAVLKSGLA